MKRRNERKMKDSPVKELFTAEFLYQPDANHPILPIVRGPLDVDDVVEGGRQLTQRGQVHWPRRPFWLDVRFVCRYGVRQITHLVIDLNTNTRGELIA